MDEILRKQDIRKNCSVSSTFSKGTKIYEQDDVIVMKLEKLSDSVVNVVSKVEGSRIDAYDVSFQLEMESSLAKLKNCNCTCHAFATYSGLCKHLVASMLELNYMLMNWELKDFLKESDDGGCLTLLPVDEEIFDEEWDEENDSIGFEEAFEELRNVLGNYSARNLYPAATISTSSGKTFTSDSGTYAVSSQVLLDTMSSIVLQDRNRFCLENTSGDVDLEVTLNIEHDKENIELRIGKKQLYVVKDISKLVEDIKEQRFVKYGKNLEFVHAQSAFSKETQPMISFLLNTRFPEKNSYYGYYYGRSSDKRYLQLENHMLDELLQMFEGKRLLVQNFRDYYKSEILVKREDPLLPVYIKGENDGKKTIISMPEIILLNGVYWFYICWDQCIYACSEEFCKDMREIVKLMAVNWIDQERKQNHYTGKKLRPLELCEKDYLSFCSTLLPILEKYMEVTIEGVDFSKYQAEEGSFELYLDLLENQEVVCNAKAKYGDKEHNLIRSAQLSETYRDIKSEYEIRTLLNQYFPEKTKDGQSYLLQNDDDRLAALIEDGMEQLRMLADVYASEAFKKIRIASKVVVTTGLSIKGNLLNISWDVSGMSSEELLDILGSYRRKKKYHRLRNGELLNLSNGGLETFADMQEDLQITKAQLKAGMADVPLYRTLYLDSLMKENADKIMVSRDEHFEKLMEQFDAIKGRHYELPGEVDAELRPYQMEGYQWARILAELGFGGILADDMGLGKTLQMIANMCSDKEGVHLVVCPASLVYNWEAEFHKFAPSVKVCLMVGSAIERKKLIEQYEEYQVVITSYDLLKRDIELYIGKKFNCEIIDEAQYIKNPTTQAAKAVKAIASRNRFALTGTPIENRLSELWSIFEYLMPGYLYSYKHFKENFEEHIVQGSKESENKALARLHAMIQPFLLRRLKKDVLKELPEKIEEVVYSKLGKEQEKLYKATEKNIVQNLRKKTNQEFKENKLQILAEITRLREICCDPSLLYDNYNKGSAKLDTCLELIDSAIEGGHKLLLFSQFASMLEILSAKLKEKKIRTLLLTGSTSKVKRREMVQQFQEGRAEVFLISLKAGGTGLNLTAADVVIHYDPWWNVAAQNQATDRAHRIGQENNVTVMKLIARNTIEERIVKLQEKKQDLADKIISGEGVSMSSLSREELLSLFSG